MLLKEELTFCIRLAQASSVKDHVEDCTSAAELEKVGSCSSNLVSGLRAAWISEDL